MKHIEESPALTAARAVVARTPERDRFDQRLESATNAIDEGGHRELFNTDVRDHIADALTEPLEGAGIDAEDITAT